MQSKYTPEIGMNVRWNMGTGEGKTSSQRMAQKMALIYKHEGLRVHLVKKRRAGPLVALTKWGAPMVHQGSARLRYFRWKTLMPI